MVTLLVPALIAGAALKIPLATYEEKVYASWLGQCVGNVYGLPHENQYIDDAGPDRFPYGYTASAERMRKAAGVFSDDDTDFEYMYLLAMERHGPEPTYAQVADAWKRHVHDRVWLANRAALALMHVGYTPPVTGRRDRNPHWFQIDPTPQTIGLLSFHSGSVEEVGGWFTSLGVEHRTAVGSWAKVRGLVVDPPLTPGTQPFNKPHFVERLLAFEPVTTTAIRMIGDAGTAEHWRDPPTFFTSIAELGVYGPVPGLPGDDD